MDEQDERATRRRNVRMALAFALVAFFCYVGMYVVYLMGTG